jgi:hypothetical protein
MFVSSLVLDLLLTSINVDVERTKLNVGGDAPPHVSAKELSADDDEGFYLGGGAVRAKFD